MRLCGKRSAIHSVSEPQPQPSSSTRWPSASPARSQVACKRRGLGGVEVGHARRATSRCCTSGAARAPRRRTPAAARSAARWPCRRAARAALAQRGDEGFAALRRRARCRRRRSRPGAGAAAGGCRRAPRASGSHAPFGPFQGQIRYCHSASRCTGLHAPARLYARRAESDHRRRCDPIGGALRTTAMIACATLAAPRPAPAGARHLRACRWSLRTRVGQRCRQAMNGSSWCGRSRWPATAARLPCCSSISRRASRRYLMRAGAGARAGRGAGAGDDGQRVAQGGVVRRRARAAVDLDLHDRAQPAHRSTAPSSADAHDGRTKPTRAPTPTCWRRPAHGAARPDEQLDAARREGAVRRGAARNSRPSKCRSCGWRSTMNNRMRASPSELNVPLGTVKSRIRLAVGHLRRLLQGGSQP